MKNISHSLQQMNVKTMKETKEDTIPNSDTHYVVCSETNQRTQNEDSFLVFSIPPNLEQKAITILAVADGMGGHDYGEIMSQETLRKFSLSLFEQIIIQSCLNCINPQSHITAEYLSQVVLNALQQANAHIKRIVETNNWNVAGSTLVATAIVENWAVVVNLGDS